MMKSIQNIPFHSFLFSPLIIFFLYVHNQKSVNLEDIYRSLLISVVVSVFSFALFYKLFRKNVHKAGIFLTVLFLFLFSYGWTYDLIEQWYYSGWWPLTNIHRYLLLTIAICLTVVFAYIYTSKRSFFAFTYSMNIFIAILYFINIVELIRNYEPDQNIAAHSSAISEIKTNNKFPDIYYFILDGYANDKILQKFYNYSSNSLTSLLKDKGFYVAQNSRSNYPATAESLASSLNCNYLDSVNLLENPIYRNQVCAYLKSKGYKIVHMRSGYTVTRHNYLADTTITLDNLSEFERAFLRHTIFRLDDLAGYLHYLTLKNQIKKIPGLIEIKGPKFVFVHIVSPHPPFTCKENGSFKLKPNLTHAWWEPRSDYLEQLKFINSVVQNSINYILENSVTLPVILIQSDHGPWMQDSIEANIYEARSLILNSYYLQGVQDNNLYADITPVNSFRVVFNAIFKDSLPLIEDIPIDRDAMKNSVVFQKLKD